MQKQLSFLLFILYAITPLFAQKDSLQYDLQLMTLTSSGKYAPFWQQSIRYGSVLPSPTSTNILIGVCKEPGNAPQLLKYGYKATLLLQTDYKQTNTRFQELYVQGKLSAFDLVFGQREEYLGCQDSVMSCGGILFSKNARPMPKLTAGIEHFTPLPYSFGMLEVKGAIAHGWFTDNTYMKGIYLHHLYGYLRVGGKLPIHVSYGVDHVAQWGGYNAEQGRQPGGLGDFIRIIQGKQGGSNALNTDKINALGNHIISQSLKVEARLGAVNLSAYWQNISEDGPIELIGTTMNAPDGLWGITLRTERFRFLKGILYEYLQTTDQSGPINEKDGIVYGGTDGYFTNGVYQSGWNYFNRTIGTPFISSPFYNQNGTISTLNSRVQVHHFGAEGELSGYSYLLLASFSKNYGSYYAPFSSMVRNTSLLLEVHKSFPRFYGLEARCSLAADFGKLYGNSTSCMITLRKRGILTSY
ncbi:MAG: capsule assembly Wzi family protein [Bacteroidota bacterium]|nr:capsule assembly Wzi family protein [Bacteroidota bacterium]